MNISPKRIREIAVGQYACPNCEVKPGELCRPHGDPREIVCTERYSKAKTITQKREGAK